MVEMSSLHVESVSRRVPEILGVFNKRAVALASVSALISSLSFQADAIGIQNKPPEKGWSLELGLGANGGFSSVDYSDSTNPDPGKEKINDGLPYYYTAEVTVDPTYRFNTLNNGPFQLKLHSAIQLDDAFLDNDQIDELSIELKSQRYGNVYLGEDDGAADRLKPKQSGRVEIAVGHGAFTGVVPWWGNLPSGGGFNRSGHNTWNWDWKNGIVEGDWRSTARDTQDAIKIGYESPILNGFRFGASVNLQDTFAGSAGPEHPAEYQDSWDHLGLKNDEYELALQWNGKTARGLDLSAGLIQSSVHIANEDMLQKGTDAGIKVGKKLDSGDIISGSVFYSYEDYDNDKADRHAYDQQAHVGFDWTKRKWKVGINYVQSWDYWNPLATKQLGGGGNRGYSIGVDYKLAKGLTLGTGIIYARNDAGEKATEVGLNMMYHYNTFIY